MTKKIANINKIIGLIVVSVLMITMVSCGKNQKIELTYNGMGTETDVKLIAEGDEITSWEQSRNIPVSLFTAEELEKAMATGKEKTAQINALKGCRYTFTIDEDDVEEEMYLAINKDTIGPLIEYGVLGVDSDSGTVNYLSFEKTVANLKASGFIEDK